MEHSTTKNVLTNGELTTVAENSMVDAGYRVKYVCNEGYSALVPSDGPGDTIECQIASGWTSSSVVCQGQKILTPTKKYFNN